jgi:hypothetical protein
MVQAVVAMPCISSHSACRAVIETVHEALDESSAVNTPDT